MDGVNIRGFGRSSNKAFLLPDRGAGWLPWRLPKEQSEGGVRSPLTRERSLGASSAKGHKSGASLKKRG